MRARARISNGEYITVHIVLAESVVGRVQRTGQI